MGSTLQREHGRLAVGAIVGAITCTLFAFGALNDGAARPADTDELGAVEPIPPVSRSGAPTTTTTTGSAPSSTTTTTTTTKTTTTTTTTTEDKPADPPVVTTTTTTRTTTTPPRQTTTTTTRCTSLICVG